jgi:hypothetical protein
MFTNAFNHMMWVGGGTVATSVLLRAASLIWKFYKGSPVELLDAYQHNMQIAEGKPLAEALRSRLKTAVAGTKDENADFPVTAGQQTAIPEVLGPRAGKVGRTGTADEMLHAEDAAMRQRAARSELEKTYDAQERAMDAVDFATFGYKHGPAGAIAGRELQAAIATARSRMNVKGTAEMLPERLGKQAAEQLTEKMGSRTTTQVVGDMRTLIQDAKDQLFMPFKSAYDELEKSSSQIVDLAPLRAAARGAKKRYGQDIIKALDSTDIPELKQALQAGLDPNAKRFTKGVSLFEDKSIGELEKLRKDFTEQIRRLENAPATNTSAPRAAAVLRDLRDGIDASYEKSLQPEMLTYMHNLRTGYAAAADQYERGILGKIAQDNGAGGFNMSGDDVINYLLRDPANAKAFVDTLRQSRKWVDGTLVTKPLNDATAAVVSAQEGVMSKILREYKDTITGQWNTKGLSKFLHDNNESLQTLFGVRRDATTKALVERAPGQNAMNRVTRQISEYQNAADALQERLAKQSKMFEERFGVFTSDPAVLVKTLVDEGRVGDLRKAMALVRAVGGKDGMDKFKAGLGQVVRKDVTDTRGNLTSQKIEEFLGSERGRVIGEAFGGKWTENVRLLGDMMKVRELQATGTAPGDLASQFGKGGGTLKGMYRFLRVIMPPLTASGRGLTSTVGILNDKAQKIMGAMMANPDQLEKLLAARFSKLDPLTKAGKVQLTRLGFDHVIDYWELMKNAYGRTVDMVWDTPQNEQQGKQEYEGMGNPLPVGPTNGSVPGQVPSFEKKFQGPPGNTDVEKTPRMETVPRGMGQPGDFPENTDNPQGAPLQGQGSVRTDSAIASEPLPPRGVPEGAKRIQDLQIMRAGEGLQSDASPDLTTVPKTGYIPRSFEGAAGFLGGNSPYTQGKGFQMKGPGDEGFNPTESTNVEDRRLQGDPFSSEYPKGTHGTGFMYKANVGEAPPEPTGQEMAGAAKTAVLRTQDRNTVEDVYGADVFKRIAPHAVQNAEATLKGMLDFASGGVTHMKQFGEAVKDLASGDMFKTADEQSADQEHSRNVVLEALKTDPASTIQREIAPTVNKIVKAVGGAATVVGGHLMSLMEDAVYGDEHAQAKASAEIALIVTGLSGSRFAFARPAGEVSLGAGGGRLPPEPPPRRLAGNETMRDRLRTVEGGPEIVKKEIDTLSGKLSRALQDAHEAMATGKGEIPLKVDRVRGHIQALEKASDDLMEQAKSLAPPLGPNQFKDLKAMNMTEHEYRLQMLRETNAEIDAGKREAFQLMATGRDAKMEVTPKNIKEWLEAAGVKKVTITKSDVPGSVSQYVKFPDPANKGQGMSQVRTSDHAAEAQVVRTNRDTLDTSGKNPRAGQAGKALTENISGGNFAEWKNLVEALKYRLSKSPDGQWLISPDNAPLARSFRGARNATKVKALEAERAPTISRDPNQYELPLPDTRQNYTPVAPDPTRFMTPRPPRNNPFEGLGE